jgi:phosphoglycolate phosphatase
MQKPDPQILRLTIRRAGGEVRRAIMIGDSITDVRTARAANVPVVAVDFGYSEVTPEALNADRLISSFTELPNASAASDSSGCRGSNPP